MFQQIGRRQLPWSRGTTWLRFSRLGLWRGKSVDEILLAVAAAEDDRVVRRVAGKIAMTGTPLAWRALIVSSISGGYLVIVAVHRDGAGSRDCLLDWLRVQDSLFEQLAVEAPLGGEIDEHGVAFVDGHLLEAFERERLPGRVERGGREAIQSRRTTRQ